MFQFVFTLWLYSIIFDYVSKSKIEIKINMVDTFHPLQSRFIPNRGSTDHRPGWRLVGLWWGNWGTNKLSCEGQRMATRKGTVQQGNDRTSGNHYIWVSSCEGRWILGHQVGGHGTLKSWLESRREWGRERGQTVCDHAFHAAAHELKSPGSCWHSNYY